MRNLILILVGLAILALADIRVRRFRAAGHIPANAKGTQVAWLAFVLPVLQVLWAGLYEVIRSIARGRRQKPPFGPFLRAWLTGQAQPIRKLLRFGDEGRERPVEVTEWVRPPRPPGRPRKYPEGWRAHRRTGRPRGRPRGRPCKQIDAGSVAHATHDQ